MLASDSIKTVLHRETGTVRGFLIGGVFTF
jgi:hypothetical protein